MGNKVWLNKKIIDSEAAKLSAFDRGFLLADGVFETFLLHDGEIIDWSAHKERLKKGLAYLHIPVPGWLDEIQNEAKKLFFENCSAEDIAVSRLTITRGIGQRGLNPPSKDQTFPTGFMTITKAAPPPSQLSVIVSSQTFRARNNPQNGVKLLSYSGAVAARMEAQKKGADEALILNDKGRIACAAAANIFVLKGHKLSTPAIDEGALPGTVRATILTDAADLGFDPVTDCITMEELYHADLIFTTNSVQGLLPIAHIGAASIKQNQLALKRLKQLYQPYRR